MTNTAYCHPTKYISSYIVLQVGTATGKYIWSVFKKNSSLPEDFKCNIINEPWKPIVQETT